MKSLRINFIMGCFLLFFPIAAWAGSGSDFVIEPNDIDLHYCIDGDSLDPNVLTIANTGSQTLNWSIVDVNEMSSPLPEWLSISPLSGVLDSSQSQSVTLTYHTENLQGGIYHYGFKILSPGSSTRIQMVTVDLRVSGPIINLPKNYYYTKVYQNGDDPDDQTMTIKNSGFGLMDWSIDATEKPDWLSISSLDGVLDSNQSETVTLSYDITGLNAGDYSFPLEIIAPAAENSPQRIMVDMEVIGPMLKSYDTGYNFYCREGGDHPEDQTCTIRNGGGGVLNWQINPVDKPDWLMISTLEGALLNHERETVTLSVDSSGLPVGDYSYSFEINAPNADNSPQAINVNLKIDFDKYNWSTNPGDGTFENPYQIWTPEQMNAVGDNNSGIMDKHFKLMADIDMSAYTGTKYHIISEFKGVFDGNGHIISHLTYLNTDPSVQFVGLFGTTTNAILKNIRLENVSLASNGSYTGGLVGLNNYGDVYNCQVTGSVTGTKFVGGLMGLNGRQYYLCRNTTINCHSDCDVFSINSSSSDIYAGGLIGKNDSDDIISCSARGNVVDQATYTGGTLYAGGLVGHNVTGDIKFCHFNGNVNFGGTYNKSYTGGIVGLNGTIEYNNYVSGGKIVNCCSTGEIEGANNVGGIIGYNVDSKLRNCDSWCLVNGENNVGGLAGNIHGSEIFLCSTNGRVEGDRYVGGLVGYNDYYSGLSHIAKSYSGSSVDGNDNVGGLAGSFTGTIMNCHATGAVSGAEANAGGLVGKMNQYSTIENCYAAGLVSGGATNQGGFVGLSEGVVSLCFWDIDVSGLTVGVGSGSSTGVLGQTTEQMQELTTFTSVDWDFSVDDGNAALWQLPENSYPIFTWQSLSGSSSSYSGGDGSLDNPYQITTTSDFHQLTESSADWSKYFILTADIDLSGTLFEASPIAPTNDHVNSAFQGVPFSGVFNGNGHAIRNLRIDAADKNYVGLFGRVKGGRVDHLRLENVDISGKSSVGGLVGSNSYGFIDYCQVTGSVSGTEFVGGFCGYNIRGVLTNSAADCLVEGRSSVGGIAGENANGTIRHCQAGNSVTIAGLSDYSYGGGLAGCNSGDIEHSFSTVSVIAAGDNLTVGGITGVHYSGDISSVYSTGSVSSDAVSSNYTGGFSGYMTAGSVNYSYSTSPVSAEGESGQVGGFIGEVCPGQNAICCSSFWDVESSGLTYSSGGKALNSQLMKTCTVFQNAGWSGQGWIINDGVDFPRLAREGSSGSSIPVAEEFLTGKGTFAEPYLIYTAEEFALLSWRKDILDEKIIKLMNDLDLSDVPLFPIGDLGVFTGAFNGNGYTLYNVKIHQPGSDYIGLFSKIGNRNDGHPLRGNIMNLKLVDVDIIGNDYVGGLIGANFGGYIDSCSCSGSVEATGWYSGGLSGWFSGNNGDNGFFWRSSGIYSSYSACNVSGEEFVGGLTGYFGGGDSWHLVSVISNSYACGSVIANDHAGGLIGKNVDTLVSNCYSAGQVTGEGTSVGGLTGRNADGYYGGCFWDTQTSGQNNGVGEGSIRGITGKNTTEMMTQTTFSDWDFSDADGDVADWMMLREEEDYPRLAWQEVYEGDVAGLYGVDMVDLSYLANYWGLSDCGGVDDCGRADIDGSGNVDLGDFAEVAEDWLLE